MSILQKIPTFIFSFTNNGCETFRQFILNKVWKIQEIFMTKEVFLFLILLFLFVPAQAQINVKWMLPSSGAATISGNHIYGLNLVTAKSEQKLLPQQDGYVKFKANFPTTGSGSPGGFYIIGFSEESAPTNMSNFKAALFMVPGSSNTEGFALGWGTNMPITSACNFTPPGFSSSFPAYCPSNSDYCPYFVNGDEFKIEKINNTVKFWRVSTSLTGGQQNCELLFSTVTANPTANWVVSFYSNSATGIFNTEVNFDNTAIGNINLWTRSSPNSIRPVALTDNIGIGTTLPQSNLHVGLKQDITTAPTYALNTTMLNDANFQGLRFNAYNTSSDNSKRYGDIVSLGYQTATSGGGVLRFLTNDVNQNIAAERMRIERNGNVGIGTTLPQSNLHVGLKQDITTAPTYGLNTTMLNDANFQGLRFNAYNTSSDNSKRYGDIVSLGYQTATSGGGVLRFLTNDVNQNIAAERMRIERNGNVGIGTASPSQKLHIIGGTLITGNTAIGTNPISNIQLNLGVGVVGGFTVWNGPTSFETGATNSQRDLTEGQYSLGVGRLKINNYLNLGTVKNKLGYANTSGGTSYTLPTQIVGLIGSIDSLQRLHSSSIARGGDFTVNLLNPSISGQYQVTGLRGIIHGTLNTSITGGLISAVYGHDAINQTNTWAGYFAGKVYSTSGYTTSDERLKENINNVSNALDIIKQLEAKTYNFKRSGKFALASLPTEKQYGFLAQDLEKVIPEAVTTAPIVFHKGEKGNENFIEEYKAVNYTLLIPILTQAIKDQQVQIEELKAQIENAQGNPITSASKHVSASELGATAYSLKQNNPNPFDKSTTIDFEVDNNFQTVLIAIYDLNGKQLKSYNVTGAKSLEIQAKEFDAGMYIYSLIADNKLLDSKKMVITD